eukprot:scaffold12.g7932.t1
MGQNQSLGGGGPGGDQQKKDGEKKKKYEPPVPPPRVGKKQRKRGLASSLGTKLPSVTPTAKCKLRLLKEERNEEDRTKVDELRGSPLSVGTLEEIIDESHGIVSSSVGPEYYVTIMSFVDKAQLEPGCSVLLHNKAMSVVGILTDEADPAVSVMKVEHMPSETYADVGGLESQVQEIKEAVELPLTHPELYEDIGIKPPKIHTGRMTLAGDVNIEEFVMSKDELSGADIKAMCTEAGLLALRERRMRVTQEDFKKAKEKVLYKKKDGLPEGLYM